MNSSLKKKIKYLFIAGNTFVFVIFGIIYFHPYVRFYIETLERYRSKEVCSCHYSIKRNFEACKKDWEVVSWLPYFSSRNLETINHRNYETLTVGFFRKKAIYMDEKNGCRLIN